MVVDTLGLSLFCMMDTYFHMVDKNYLGINVLSISSLSVLYTVLLVPQGNDVFLVIISWALLVLELFETPKSMLSVWSISPLPPFLK